MSGQAVETKGLTKRYGDVVAVDDLSLSVPAGSVFGLLGPNGAGKTTIIGSLLGLIRPTSGTMRVFGEDLNGGTDDVVRRIGAIMETPSFYPFMSGRDNLRYFQGIGGGVDPEEIDRLLELVGLSARGDARFHTYSLGMKHRLGLAYALLGDPELLLLDEPTNGLDPAGMAEVRGLIKRLGEGTRTVVLASHLLNEVEQVCDRVAILSHGKVIADGAVSDLIGRGDRLLVRTTDDEGAAAVLGGFDFVTSATVEGDALTVAADPARAWELTRGLAARDIYVTEMTTLGSSLEEYFLEVTEEGAS